MRLYHRMLFVQPGERIHKVGEPHDEYRLKRKGGQGNPAVGVCDVQTVLKDLDTYSLHQPPLGGAEHDRLGWRSLPCLVI